MVLPALKAFGFRMKSTIPKPDKPEPKMDHGEHGEEMAADERE